MDKSLCSIAKSGAKVLISEPVAKDFKDLDTKTHRFSVNHDMVLLKNGKPRVKGKICLISKLQI